MNALMDQHHKVLDDLEKVVERIERVNTLGEARRDIGALIAFHTWQQEFLTFQEMMTSDLLDTLTAEDRLMIQARNDGIEDLVNRVGAQLSKLGFPQRK